jgi:hypothetical protein
MEASKILYPGRDILLEDLGLTVTVYPMGYKHMKKFTGKIADALSIIGRTSYPKGADQAAVMKAVMSNITPFLMTNLLELVEECTVFNIQGVTMEDLPQWHLPVIIEAWLLESFGEEKKWKPWVTALENVLEKFTGSKTSLLATFSSSSSSPDTQ